MALQIWLPLNGNLNNLGLYNLLKDNPTQNTFSYNTNGKIGSCATGICAWKLNNDILGNEWSVALWFKTTTAFGSNNNVLFCKNISGSTDCQIYFSIINGTSLNVGVNGPSSNLSQAFTFNTDTWYHVATTYDGNKVSLYINGIFQKSTIVTTAKPENRLNIRINGRSTNEANTSGTGQLSGYNFNDFRLYNHCLSQKEVEEISKGLILHYKFNEDWISSMNLIYNGFGELGDINWTSSARVSTDVPPNTTIKQSYYNQAMIEKIPIYSTDTYQFSCYVKSTGTSGATYPSFDPYDIDNNFIYYYQEPEGFQNATKTTLAQPLNPGDTKIYATSLASWPTHTNNRYVAIFGYRDSTGYIYPDYTYTRNTIQYGTSNNLDLTNNIINLPSAYSGPIVSAGTAICQTVAGSTYWYPFGAIAKTSIADWTYKEMTFKPANVKRLSAAHYLVYRADWTNDILHAGMKLINLSLNNKVYDSSGYQNDGNINGACSITNNGGRYNKCLYIPVGQTDYIVTKNSVIYDGSAVTMNIWFKSNNKTPGSSYHHCFNGFTDWTKVEMAVHANGYLRSGFYINGTRYVANTNNTDILNGQWHMLTMTYDGINVKRYVDGILKSTQAASGKIDKSNIKLIFGHGGASPGYHCKEAHLSDARLYCTALTQEQILELYHTSATVDKSGNFYGRELME